MLQYKEMPLAFGGELTEQMLDEEETRVCPYCHARLNVIMDCWHMCRGMPWLLRWAIRTERRVSGENRWKVVGHE